MASTISLQSSINWAKTFLYLRPLNLATVNNEPAISSANLIQQTMIGPPFRWSWNRSNTTVTTANGTQDYPKGLTNLQYVEKISAALTGNKTFELEYRRSLGEASGTLEIARPRFMSEQFDDNAGNLTFRFLPVPDNVYTVTITYQKQVPLFTNLSTLWTIPDKYSYIYQYGFMALMMMFADDPRWQVFNSKFVAHLLATQEGLDEAQRNLFLDSWYATTGGFRNVQIKQDQASQARGI